MANEGNANAAAAILTGRQAQTCALAWHEGLSYRQIAAMHGIAERTVQTRVLRARRRLRAAGITPPGDPRRRHQRATPAQLSLLSNY